MEKPKRASRRKLPWPRSGAPISLSFEDVARKVRYARMFELKKHYGIQGEDANAWYQLAAAIASEFDEGLKIVAYPRPLKRNWKGADGYVLIQEVQALKETTNLRTDLECLRYIKAEQANYKDVSLPELQARHAEAKRHHLPPKRLRTWDGRIITRR